MFEGRLFAALELDEIDHLAVHLPRAKRAPEGYDELLVAHEAEFIARITAGSVHDRLPHGRACQHHVAARFQLQRCLLIADKDFIRPAGKRFGGHARKGIDLEDRHRDPELRRRVRHREAGISPRADDRVGLK